MRNVSILVLTFFVVSLAFAGSSTICKSIDPGQGGGNRLLAYLTYSASIPYSLRPVYIDGKEVTHYGVILTAWGSGSKLEGTYTAVWKVHIWGWLYYSKSILTDKYQKNWREAYVYFY